MDKSEISSELNLRVSYTLFMDADPPTCTSYNFWYVFVALNAYICTSIDHSLRAYWLR